MTWWRSDRAFEIWPSGRAWRSSRASPAVGVGCASRVATTYALTSSFYATPPIQGAMSEYAVIRADFAHPAARPRQLRAGSAVRARLGGHPLLRPDRRHSPAISVVHHGRRTHRADGDRSPRASVAPGSSSSATSIPAGSTSLAAWAPSPSTCAPRTSQPSCGQHTAGVGAEALFDTSGIVRSSRRLPTSCARAAPSRWWACPPRTRHLPDAHRGHKELSIHGVFRYANTYPAAIALVASGQFPVEAVVTDRYRTR